MSGKNYIRIKHFVSGIRQCNFAKKHNDMNRFFEKHGYYAILTIGIFLGENTDPNELIRCRYLTIKAEGLAGDGPELSYAAINIVPWALSIHAGKFNQTSFIFHVILPDGKLHSELWEKQDSSQRYHYKKNPFAKKDESDTWVECKSAEDSYTIIDKKFNYSVTIPTLIEDGINENIQNMIRQDRLIDTPTHINDYIEFSYKNCGFGGYAQRCRLYRGIFTKLENYQRDA